MPAAQWRVQCPCVGVQRVSHLGCYKFREFPGGWHVGTILIFWGLICCGLLSCVVSGISNIYTTEFKNMEWSPLNLIWISWRNENISFFSFNAWILILRELGCVVTTTWCWLAWEGSGRSEYYQVDKFPVGVAPEMENYTVRVLHSDMRSFYGWCIVEMNNFMLITSNCSISAK